MPALLTDGPQQTARWNALATSPIGPQNGFAATMPPTTPHPSPSTEPAALSVAATQPIASTQAATTQPTTEPTTYDMAKGDVIQQAKLAIDNVGLTQTVTQTPITGWIFFAFGLLAGLVLARLTSSIVGRAGRHAAERVRLIRAVLINSFAGPLSLLVFMFGFGFGLTFLHFSQPLRHSLIVLFQVLNLIWIGWLLYNLVDLITIVLGRWSRGRQGNLSVMLVPVARKTLRVVLVTVLVLFAAENIFDQPVQTFLTGLGIAGLAVSLAAQDTLRNFFGSIMIFADQPFAIGDSVKITDLEGTVEDIGFRSTRLRTADGYVATIPNGNIAGAAVLNYSRRRGIRRTLDVTLPADAPPEQMSTAIALLRETMNDPDVVVGLDPKQPATVTFDDPTQRRARIIYWFRNNDPKAYAQHAERLNLGILERFHKAGISFK